MLEQEKRTRISKSCAPSAQYQNQMNPKTNRWKSISRTKANRATDDQQQMSADGEVSATKNIHAKLNFDHARTHDDSKHSNQGAGFSVRDRRKINTIKEYMVETRLPIRK